MSLTTLTQVTTAPGVDSNKDLLKDIAELSKLNPKERQALKVFCLAEALANISGSPITTFSNSSDANKQTLLQWSKTYIGALPKGAMEYADLAIAYSWMQTAGAGLLSTADGLRTYINGFVDLSDDELKRMELFLKLELVAAN